MLLAVFAFGNTNYQQKIHKALYFPFTRRHKYTSAVTGVLSVIFGHNMVIHGNVDFHVFDVHERNPYFYILMINFIY